MAVAIEEVAMTGEAVLVVDAQPLFVVFLYGAVGSERIPLVLPAYVWGVASLFGMLHRFGPVAAVRLRQPVPQRSAR